MALNVLPGIEPGGNTHVPHVQVTVAADTPEDISLITWSNASYCAIISCNDTDQKVAIIEWCSLTQANGLKFRSLTAAVDAISAMLFLDPADRVLSVLDKNPKSSYIL